MRQPGYAERCEEWPEHRRKMAFSPVYRARWHAQHPRGSKPIPPSVKAEHNGPPRLQLAKFILAADCAHVVRVRVDEQWACQECSRVFRNES